MGFLKKIINTLRKPGETMRDISNTPFIEEAVMIVGIYALANAVDFNVRSSKLVQISEISLELMNLIGFIFALLYAFLTWFILAWIFHNISLFAGGKGRFYPHMMVLAGYAMLPLIFGTILSTSIIYTTETTVLTIDPSENLKMLQDIQKTTPYLIATFINSVAWIWSLIIISHGLAIHQKLSKKTSVIIVAIPPILLLGLSQLIKYGLG